MSPEIVSIIGLVLIFIVGGALRINMGIIALIAAAIVGFIFLNPEDGPLAGQILAGFPVGIFVLVVGVTLLTAVMVANGTIDWIVRGLVRLVRGRIIALPWLYFVISAVMSTLGPGAVPFLVGLGVKMTKQYNMSPMLITLMIVQGHLAGGISPLTPYGAIIKGLTAEAGLSVDLWAIWLVSMITNFVFVTIAFFGFGGHKLLSVRDLPDEAVEASVLELVPVGASEKVVVDASGAIIGGGGGTPSRASGDDLGEFEAATTRTVPTSRPKGERATLANIASLIGLFAFVALTAVFQYDLAFTAIGVAALLLLFSPGTDRERAVGRAAWGAAWLIAGVLTFMGVATKLGTIEFVVQAVGSVGTPLIAVLIACFIAAIVSALASSTAVITIVVALVLPFIEQGDLSVIGTLAAIVVCATIVDVTPFSAYGVMMLGAAEGQLDTRKLTNGLLLYAILLALVVPPLLWAVLVVPGWLP